MKGQTYWEEEHGREAGVPVHIPEASGRIASLQTASNPIECCKLGSGQGGVCAQRHNLPPRALSPGQGALQDCARPTGDERRPKLTKGPRDRARFRVSLCFTCGGFHAEK